MPLRYSLAIIATLILVVAFPSSAHAKRVDPVVKAKQIARHLLYHRGWQRQYWALDGIIVRESHWHTWARNPSSGACGIAQALPCSKMASFGAAYRTSAAVQLKWMLRYIEVRYGNPASAYYFRTSRGWY